MLNLSCSRQWVLRAVIALLLLDGAVRSWLGRHEMNSDGVAYLDHAVQALAQGPGALISDYWSPAYPSLIAVLLRLLHPPVAWVFPVVHLATFLTYVLALVCCLYLVRQLAPDEETDPRQRLSLQLFALAVFFWGEMSVTSISKAEPDYLAAGAIFLASALVLRAVSQPDELWRWILAGAALGLGYLCKFVLLPLSVVLLGGLAIFWRRHPPSRVLAATGALAAAVLPWGYLLSTRLDGGPTLGRAGVLNLPWVGSESEGRMAGGIVPMVGRFQQLHEAPAVFHYGAHSPGTYPVWYEPAYWSRLNQTTSPAPAGESKTSGRATPVASRRASGQEWGKLWVRLSRRVTQTSGQYRVILRTAAVLLAAICVLLWRADRPVRMALASWLAARYWLWGWALAGLAGYWVTWVEGRYVGPLLVVIFLTLFTGMVVAAPVAAAERFGEVVRVAMSVAALGLALPAMTDFPGAAASAAKSIWSGDPHQGHTHMAAGQWLRSSGGIPEGSMVGFIGSPFMAYFLQPAGLRAVQELPRGHVRQYCELDPAGRRRVRDSMWAAGARLIAAEDFVWCLNEAGWTRIPGTPFLALLREP